MILSRDRVRAAYEREMALHNDHDAAVLAAAQALGVDPALVREALETLSEERHEQFHSV